jgi:hypothetical protein
MLPIFLSTFNRAKTYLIYIWEGEMPSNEEVEKAVIRMKKDREYEGL